MKSLLLVEVAWLSPTLLVTDRCLKSTPVRLLGIENSDSGDLCIKFTGTAADIAEAGRLAERTADEMHVRCRVALLPSADVGTNQLARAEPVFGEMLQTYDAYVPREMSMNGSKNAIGLLETQGLSVNLQAVDAMLKTSSVEVLGKEKIGGGYVTIMIRGDLAAVQAAINAGRATVERQGGTLILADLISNPHPELLSLLPAKV